MGRWLKPEDF